MKEIIADAFEVLVDTNSHEVVALQVNPKRGAPLVLPMTVRTAQGLGEYLLGTVLAIQECVERPQSP